MLSVRQGIWKNVQPVTAAKFITKSSLFIQLLGVIRWLELKLNSEQKVENIFVAPPYCQTASYVYNSINLVTDIKGIQKEQRAEKDRKTQLAKSHYNMTVPALFLPDAEQFNKLH